MKNRLFCLCFIIVMFFCSCENKENVDLTEITTVNVKEVKLEKLNQDLSTFGSISYSLKNDVTTQVAGSIISMNVKEGDSVKKGKILAKLKNVQLDIQVAQAKNDLDSAKAALIMAESKLQDSKLNIESRLLNLEKQILQIQQQELELKEAELNLEKSKELLNVGGITQANFDREEISFNSKKTSLAILKKDFESNSLGFRDEDLIINGILPSSNKETKRLQLIDLNTRTSKAELISTKAALANAEKNLDLMKALEKELLIIAPCDGVIGANYFEKGEYVSENEKIFTVMEVDNVHAIFNIHEDEISYFSKGSFLEIEIPSLKYKEKTTILEISPVVDSQSGNFSVKANVKNKDGLIRPGMFVKCYVNKNDSKNYPVIMETSLLNNSENTAEVFICINDLLVKKNIKIIEKKDGKVWIEGLKVGDLVVDNPSPFLKEGCNVKY